MHHLTARVICLQTITKDDGKIWPQLMQQSSHLTMEVLGPIMVTGQGLPVRYSGLECQELSGFDPPRSYRS